MFHNGVTHVSGCEKASMGDATVSIMDVYKILRSKINLRMRLLSTLPAVPKIPSRNTVISSLLSN
jgi:hypothetical protein